VTIEFGLLILGAYLLGSVPAAYIVARWSRGIDIRQHGSGNVGTSNVWMLTSKWLAIVVIIFDLGKGMVMVWAAQLMGLGIAQQVTAGLAAIAGHNWPIFLRFSGGRGGLTTLGVALTLPVINNLVPWGIIVFLVMAALSWFIVHDSSLGVGGGIAAMPLVSWGVGEPLPMTLGFLGVFLIMVIRRLTAPKTFFAASVPKRQLFMNRLLFDRDIRDRKAWIHQTLPEASQQKNKGKDDYS